MAAPWRSIPSKRGSTNRTATIVKCAFKCWMQSAIWAIYRSQTIETITIAMLIAENLLLSNFQLCGHQCIENIQGKIYTQVSYDLPFGNGCICIKQPQPEINKYNILIIIPERTCWCQNGSIDASVSFQRDSEHPKFGSLTTKLLFHMLQHSS